MTFWAVVAILTQVFWFGSLLLCNDVNLMATLAIIAGVAAIFLAAGVLSQKRVRYVGGKTLEKVLVGHDERA